MQKFVAIALLLPPTPAAPPSFSVLVGAFAYLAPLTNTSVVRRATRRSRKRVQRLFDRAKIVLSYLSRNDDAGRRARQIYAAGRARVSGNAGHYDFIPIHT
jgi:hypothetical protein